MRFLIFFFVLIAPLAIVADQELPLLGENAQLNLQNEFELGQSLYDRLKQAGYVIDDPLLSRYLSDIGESLLAQMDLRLRDYHFFLVKDASVNAFAAPGGFIGVNVGLIAMTRSEDELASVLAHEIAHVKLMHTMQMIENAQKVNALSVLSIFAAILLSSQDPDIASAMIYGGAAGSSQAIVNFTRSNEYEADRVGVELLKKSQYNPIAMVDFMRMLQQKDQSGEIANIEYIRTHPISSNRIAEIAGRVGSSQEKKENISRYSQFKDYLSYLYPELGASDRKSDFFKSLSLMHQGQFEQATSSLQQLSKHDPDSIWINYALAESLDFQQKYDAAVKIYNSLLLLYPEDLAITIKLVNVLTQKKQYQLALENAHRAVQQNEKEASGYKMLVELYKLTRDPVLEQLAEANYHWFSGNRKQAVVLYRALINEGLLDLVNEQKVKERLAKNISKEDGISK